MPSKAILTPVFAFVLLGSAPSSAQENYNPSQIRVVRQLASARAMADLCGGLISASRTATALRAVGLSEGDLQRTPLRDELAKQRIALVDSYEALAMTNVGRREALQRQCIGLERLYGPRGTVIPGLAIQRR